MIASEEINGTDPEETLAIGITFGNSNSGIAYTNSVGTGLQDKAKRKI